MKTYDDEEVRNLINKEIYCCQSSLVEKLFKKEIFTAEEISNYFHYTCPYCSSDAKERNGRYFCADKECAGYDNKVEETEREVFE